MFLIQLLDFYKKLDKEGHKFEWVVDKEILNFYFSRVGKNFILDSYLQRSFFVTPCVIDMIAEEDFRKVALNFYSE